jgi:hypothetical protein
MLSRSFMFAFAVIAAFGTTGLAPTSAFAFGDGSARVSHRGISSFAQRLDPYKTIKFGHLVASRKVT